MAHAWKACGGVKSARGFESLSIRVPVIQQVEISGLEPEQCEFESHRGHISHHFAHLEEVW